MSPCAFNIAPRPSSPSVASTTLVSSVQFSPSVVSDSLHPQVLQHTRPPCPSPSPWVCSNSCSLSQWCHPIISSSVIPFSSSLQSFPESGSFPMSQFFPSGGQSIGVSVSASVLPMIIQEWFPLGLTLVISFRKNWLIWKDPDAGKDWRQEEKGRTEYEMAGWFHWLNGHEFE